MTNRLHKDMLRRLLVLVAALAFAACAAPANSDQTPSIRLVDLTDEFDVFWQQTGEQPGSERAAAFRAHFELLLPGFFNAARVGSDPVRYDEHIARGLAGYARQRDAIREISARFSSLFLPALRRFEGELGPVELQRPIYLINSLGEMDGGMRDLPGGSVLIFGADMIAFYHRDHSVEPLFHHELFHAVHLRRFRSCDEMWCALWVEGLATYAAARLNPGATDAELLFEIPEPIRPAVEANRVEAVCAVRDRLDSTASADRQALFSFQRFNERLPPRFGYYVGYLVAAEIGRNRSLRSLATLQADEVRPMIDQALGRLARCPEEHGSANRPDSPLLGTPALSST